MYMQMAEKATPGAAVLQASKPKHSWCQPHAKPSGVAIFNSIRAPHRGTSQQRFEVEHVKRRISEIDLERGAGPRFWRTGRGSHGQPKPPRRAWAPAALPSDRCRPNRHCATADTNGRRSSTAWGQLARRSTTWACCTSTVADVAGGSRRRQRRQGQQRRRRQRRQGRLSDGASRRQWQLATAKSYPPPPLVPRLLTGALWTHPEVTR